MVVETSCGECQFRMKGKSCDLAIRINNKTYFVDGTAIDDHGNAHADDGFCKAVRHAEVQGEIVNGRFKATNKPLYERLHQLNRRTEGKVLRMDFDPATAPAANPGYLQFVKYP